MSVKETSNHNPQSKQFDFQHLQAFKHMSINFLCEKGKHTCKEKRAMVTSHHTSLVRVLFLVLGSLPLWQGQSRYRNILTPCSPVMENSEINRWPSGLMVKECRQPTSSVGSNTFCRKVPVLVNKLTEWLSVSATMIWSTALTNIPPGEHVRPSAWDCGLNWRSKVPAMSKILTHWSGGSLTTTSCWSVMPTCRGQFGSLLPLLNGTVKHPAGNRSL